MRAFLVAATLMTAGCVSMGTNYDPRAVEALRPGEPMAEVIAALGQPNSRTAMADGQTMLMWLHSRGTALGTGQARSVSLLFDANGRYVRTISSTDVNMH